MNILITGGNGYLGSKLVEKLANKENKIVLLILKGSNIDLFRNKDNIHIYSTSKDDIKNAFKENIDLIIHLATSYGRNGETTEEVLNGNLIFPLKVIECAIKNNVKYFFNMDTAIQRMINNYTMSKMQFKEWGKFFAEQEKIRFINMKSEHFYGPFDSEIKFVAKMLRDLRNNVPYIETTLGEQKRAFIYIDDIINAILCIIKYETNKEELKFVEYELGPDYNITIKEALNTMKRLTKSKSEIKFGAIPYRKNEEMESRCNNSKLKLIGWKQATLTFEEGISKILKEEAKE